MESLTTEDTENKDPQIIAAFRSQNCGEGGASVLVTNYDGNKITPRKDGWMPEEETLYVCERPWLGKPSFCKEDSIPVFSVLVHPWIIGNPNNKVIDMVFVNPESRIDKNTLPQVTFGAEAIMYCEIGETRYVWIKNPKYVEIIENALTKKEIGRKSWEKVVGDIHLLKAPSHGMYHDEVVKVITEIISKEE